MSNSQNKKNEQQNNLCTTLTEQWKKGELPTGDYYVKPRNGQVFVYHINHSVKHIYHNHAGEIKEVLAPVPSYKEWKQLHKFLEEFNALDVAKENEQLKLIIKRTKASGNYPGRVSAYKARIIHLSEENQQLKGLLKECKPYIGYSIKKKEYLEWTPPDSNILTVIDNAIREKKQNGRQAN